MVGKLQIVFCFVCLFFFIPFIASSVYAAEIKINEVFVHPSSGSHEWIELYNPDKTAVATYWIDDDTDFASDAGGSAKKSLATVQQSDTQYPYIELTSSMFNNDGDAVVLFDENGTIVDQYIYKNDPGVGVSLGRSPDGSGEFAILTAATKGSANTAKQPSPTLSPTKIPTPTHTPKPTHTPTPTKIPPPTPTPKVTPITVAKVQETVSQTNTGKKFVENNTSIVDELVPSDTVSSLSATASSQEAVLVASISAKPTIVKKQKKLVKPSQELPIFSIIFSGLGGVCLLACGILMYQKIRGENQKL